VTGKGGVGKTSVSVALALRAAALGLKPLVVSCDGKPTVGRVMGRVDEEAQATDLGNGVHALRVDFNAALTDLIAAMLGARRLVEAFLANRVVRTFVHAAPSVMELTLLHRVDRARTAEAGGPFGPIIVDLPASGHALALLSTPRMVMRLVRMGPLYRRAVELLRLLNDSTQTALCVVTLAEELPINETIELVARAKGLGIPVGHVVVNAVPPSGLQGEDLELMSRLKTEAAGPLQSWAAEVLDGSHRASRAQAEIDRLLLTGRAPVAQVPFLPDSGAALANAISAALPGGVVGPAT
jgi:anion-transporting  ArsA/GET3 family ATPase